MFTHKRLCLTALPFIAPNFDSTGTVQNDFVAATWFRVWAAQVNYRNFLLSAVARSATQLPFQRERKHVNDCAYYFDLAGYRRSSLLALQQRLGILSKRRTWIDRGHRAGSGLDGKNLALQQDFWSGRLGGGAASPLFGSVSVNIWTSLQELGIEELDEQVT